MIINHKGLSIFRLDDEFEDEDLAFAILHRGGQWDHTRIDWETHVSQLIHEDKFHVEYLMELRTFQKLCEILHSSITRKFNMSRLSQPISDEVIVGVGLRFLGGGALKDIRHVYGLSIAAVYECKNDFITAVNTCPHLEIKLPSSADEWEAIRKGFESKSTGGLMKGCVGAIDGFFQRMNSPMITEVNDVKAYYSGHYEAMGFNCQAACDSRLKFLYFGVVAPGKWNDNAAYPLCKDL